MKGQASSVVNSMMAKISFKIIVVGDLSVGKTSLVMRYIKDIFTKDYKVTVGFEFFSKVIKYDDEDVTVQIWDTAGQQAFRSMIRSFYRGAACVILMFSMAKPQTLDALDKWNSEVKEYSHPDVVKILVGSKSDLVPGDNTWLAAKAEEYCQKNKMDLYMQISSKNATNVQELFIQIVQIMYKRFHSNNDYRELVMPSKMSFILPPDPDDDEQETGPTGHNDTPKPKKRKQKGEGCC